MNFWSLFGQYILYCIQQNMVLICIFGAMVGILWHNSTIGKKDVSSFRFVIYALFAMSFFDTFDHFIDTLGPSIPASLITHRYVASLIAYISKPVIPMLISYGVCKNHKRFTKFLWLPEACNALIYLLNAIPATRFYAINEANEFIGVGLTPWLTISAFVFSGIYLVHIVVNSYIIFKDKKIGEVLSISFIGIGCLGGYIIESVFSIYNLGNQMAAVGVLYFYCFLVIKYTRVDPLTNLYNRQTFFANMNETRNVSGIISIDMNNLKYYNDTYGHAKGDEALSEIGLQIRNNIDKKNMSAYRMGGDEFLVVCSNMSEEQVKIAMSKISFAVNRTTEFEIAIGYSYRSNNDPIQYLISAADESMYTQKQQMKKDTLKVKKNLNRK